MDFNHESVTEFKRELDLRKGLSTVTHTADGVQYTRETFASYPDNVIVYRVSASENGKVNMTVRPEIAFNGTKGKDSNNDGRTGTVVADLENKTMARIHPLEIGLDGQIKEYQQEGKYLTDIYNGKQIPGTDKHHRHNSQLMLLHPGDLITTETPKYMEAAEKTLNLRGDGATGWSMGQKFNMWARLHDGNHAYDKLFVNLMKNGTATNLFDLHPPFQIDGNFGGTAGLAELLMQSHTGYVDILPALPDALASGSVSGLVAEGNFVIDLGWANKQITSLRVTSRSGKKLHIKAGAVTKVIDTTSGNEITAITYQEDGSFGFATQAGHTYEFTVAQSADLSGLQAAVDAHQDFSVYAYTDGGEFASLLKTATYVVTQGNCYVPTVDELTDRLEAAFNALTARDAESYGAVLALRLKDKVEDQGISTENANAYRVYGGPVISAAEAALERGSAEACWVQGLELMETLKTYGKNLTDRGELYALLVQLNETALTDAALGAAHQQAETVLLNTEATSEQIAAAVAALRDAAAGVADLWQLTIAAEAGGSISPAMNASVLTGTSLTVNMTPEEGYEILDLLVNGKSVGAVGTYTLDGIYEDTTVTARFRRVDATDQVSELLRTAIALAESLSADKYQDFTAVEAALTEAKACEDASPEEKTEKAQALLDAIDLLQPKSSFQGTIEAESQGVNVAWDDSWDSSKSGAPSEPDVQAKIDAFREDGKTIIVGYGESGKTHSRPGSTNMYWEIDKQSKFSGGGQLTSRAKDPWIQFTFTGERVQFITEKAQTACVADVYIDGTLLTRLDLSTTNKSGLQKELVFDSADYEASQDLTQGKHTILIWAKDVGVESASGKPYQILRADAFTVYGSPDTVDKTELAEAMAAAKLVDTADYTADTAEALRQAMEQGEAVLCREDAAQDAVEQAVSALTEAMRNLEKTVKNITEIVSPADVSTLLGTAFADIGLPKTVVVRTANGGTYKMPVTWDGSEYSADREENQTIHGEIVLGEGFENPRQLKAAVIVRVASELQSIPLNRSELSLKTGGSFALKVIGDQNVSWASTDTSVATVDSNGKVRAVGVGTATVIAAAANGQYTACCVVTVRKKSTSGEGSSIAPPTDIQDPDAPLAQPLPFRDVPEYEWYYEAVKYVFDNSIMNGTDRTTFLPNSVTTRAAIVTILYRMENEPETTGASFEDVESDEWYTDAIGWAAANGIVKGYNATTFGPDDAITREQMAAILFRYAAYKGYDVTSAGDLASFPDMDEVSDYAVESLSWAVGHQLVNGSRGSLLPQDNATRAQIAQVIMNFCENLAKEEA